jgi:hypothetical protein
VGDAEKKRNPDAGEAKRDNERQKEATSKETLRDLEDEEDVGSGSIKPDPGPSPDGAFDESDEIKDAGPM